MNMSKDADVSICTRHNGDHNADTDEFGNASELSRDAVTFVPSCEQVELALLNSVEGNPSASSGICNERSRWILILASVVAVLILMLIPVCVYMLHLHSTISGPHDIDDCSSSPCRGIGTCRDVIDGYMCDCEAGFTGDLCETDIDECAGGATCFNGATCHDGINSYYCQCDGGYTGANCEHALVPAAVGTCPSGFVTFHDLVRCYHIEEDEDDYESAQGVCAQKNATLASLETASELEAVGSHFSLEGRYYMLSARRSNVDGLLYWNTGQLLSNTHAKWASNQPRTDSDCVGAVRHDGVTKYYSIDCWDIYRPYVCERIMDTPAGVSDCRIMPCMHGATCHNVTGGGFSCQCPSAFTGQYCIQNIDDCISQPCLNGATCRDGLDKYTCDCAHGFMGERCEWDIDDCASQPCHNQGTCIDGPDKYTCVCPANHTGARCGAGPDDPCLPEFEFYDKEGRCYLVREGSVFEDGSTICATYGALLASFESAEELKFVGSLFAIEGMYHTTSGFRIDNNSFRWGTGVALPRNDKKWHTGQPSYGDLVAAIRDDDDTTLYTMPNDIGKPYVCEMAMLLPPGVNDCRSMPCLNGASCQNVFYNTYTCSCATGFVGQRCETDVDECAIDHCVNDATCVNTPGSYSCQCAPGYTGPRCATDINAPCSEEWVFFSHGGRCFLIRDGFGNELRWQDAEVVCQQKGGSLASLETPEEVDFVGGYFKGLGRYHILSARKSNDHFFWNTGEPLPASHPKWHSNQPDSGDCTALINSGGESAFYSIECSYERPFVCEMPMFLPPGAYNCQSTPCKNGGECHILGINTFYCNCTMGFTGLQCETDVDECLAKICENGGVCINAYGTYDCECVSGYGGLHCEHKKTPALGANV